jgi:hypothetical protein
MTESVVCEPYLSDYAVSFHQVFTLIDPAMNTSEIKPLHLAVPRTRSTGRPSAAPKADGSAATLVPSPQPATHALPPVHPVLPNVIAQTLTQPSKPPKADEVTVQDNKALTDALLKLDDFWLFPLGPATTIRFIVTIDTSTRSWIFKLLTESESQVLLTATMKGRSRSDGVYITAGPQDRPIGEGKLDKAANAFFCGVTLGGDRGEAGSWVFDTKEFLMPAIKKIDGKARMCLIPMLETSGLFARAAQNAKEAIRFKCVDAADDARKHGKLERPSPSNVQLFHESNPKKIQCSFGGQADGNWMLEVTYPLSPLQGFIVAVAATIP